MKSSDIFKLFSLRPDTATMFRTFSLKYTANGLSGGIIANRLDYVQRYSVWCFYDVDSCSKTALRFYFAFSARHSSFFVSIRCRFTVITWKLLKLLKRAVSGFIASHFDMCAKFLFLKQFHCAQRTNARSRVCVLFSRVKRNRDLHD